MTAFIIIMVVFVLVFLATGVAQIYVTRKGFDQRPANLAAEEQAKEEAEQAEQEQAELPAQEEQEN